jgi:hypothetical protein
MLARGKRAARRPWYHEHTVPRPERPKYRGNYAFSGLENFLLLSRGDALRACPWLSYSAPLALSLDFEAKLLTTNFNAENNRGAEIAEKCRRNNEQQ